MLTKFFGMSVEVRFFIEDDLKNINLLFNVFVSYHG